ncbi:MAG: NADP-dependent oxidoreductase [Gimesia sp.]|jgi:NADPH-dependent curcumin reductase CurA|uniref:NADP-dependent oxidoreductase n=1 Tax=Gimesia maris TaxID=122 RepID=A0A3D3RCF6_9PLAN|nr:NADP-dependent oxidoreductase [Gimesia sp.]HCO26479.1 NADP-dependent oxidoreductase [Gimesia maris]|tara:strand:- start:19684 stop:20688 length:1005 start_codon:yes stop_codon:yes gene_type:complete
MQSRHFQLTSYPEGLPTLDNFELVETEIKSPAENQFLVQNEWLSVDPYMRGRMREGESYVKPFQIGEPMEGACVGKVVESRHPQYSEGDYVLGNQGWRDAWLSEGTGVMKVDPEAVPLQAYLSILGMTGMTAYVGLLKIGELKEGDRVFVSAASGAVGSIVCQIAKIHGCFVVGSAGSKQKIEWLKAKADIDAAFNYKEVDDVSARLKELAPEGIDLYYDNVGGDHLQAALDNLNDFGRIVSCGMISTYNDKSPQPGPDNLFKIISRRLRMQGFIVRDHDDIREEFQNRMTEWIQAGKMHWEETVTTGLEKTPQAFIDLFHGSKMGKAIVKVSE